MQSAIPSTLIIGAGFTGLTVAHYLRKAGIPFMAVDRSSHPGGVIKTVSEKGFTYEIGPNTGVLGSSEIVELFEDLQKLCQLEIANKKACKRYILKNGDWVAIPSGMLEGIKTPLFTTRDKLRLLLEPFRKRGNDPHETLAQLVRRRMGNSFLEYAVDPFINGIYAGSPDLLVTKYALPKLYNLEQKYGSFIGGALRKQFEKKGEAEKKVTREVFSAKGGLSNLATALYESCGHENFVFNASDIKVDLVKNSEDSESKEYLPDNACKRKVGNHNNNDLHPYCYKVKWRINGATETNIFRNVVFTGGSHDLSGIFSFIDQQDIANIINLRYAGIVEVALGFNQWKGINLDGFGGLIPSGEQRNLLGVLYISTLFEGRAPHGGALLNVFMGGVRTENVINLPDDKIEDIVRGEISELMRLTEFKPDLFRILRYKHAIPQYEVSSGARFETIANIEAKFPGLILGGNMRDGIGLADRAKQGKMLAKQVINLEKWNANHSTDTSAL